MWMEAVVENTDEGGGYGIISEIGGRFRNVGTILFANYGAALKPLFLFIYLFFAKRSIVDGKEYNQKQHFWMLKEKRKI